MWTVSLDLFQLLLYIVLNTEKFKFLNCRVVRTIKKQRFLREQLSVVLSGKDVQ